MEILVGVQYRSPDSLVSNMLKYVVHYLGDWAYFSEPLVIHLIISWLEILLQANTRLDYILELEV